MKSAVKRLVIAALILGAAASSQAFIPVDEIFDQPSVDSLAPRDSFGPLHQMPAINATDTAPRHHWRAAYYFHAPEQLIVEPAYVGALQRDLRRLGYYCGPIDGYFSAEVSDAISRLQKNYSMRVTGTLTDPVRRALHLP